MATIAFCTQCGQGVRGDDRFCKSCGHDLTGTADALPYLLSPRRIAIATLLSGGMYLFYWFYLNWRHYRDHTGETAHPFWHVMALGVPVYGQYRTHAHMRTFRRLMHSHGLDSTIRPGWIVFWVAAIYVLGMIPLSGVGNAVPVLAVAVFMISVETAVIATILMLRVQNDLNRYWDIVSQSNATDVRRSRGEIFLIAVGILSWVVSLSTLFS